MKLALFIMSVALIISATAEPTPVLGGGWYRNSEYTNLSIKLGTTQVHEEWTNRTMQIDVLVDSAYTPEGEQKGDVTLSQPGSVQVFNNSTVLVV
ncbi:MAG: hypothetical protein MUD10_03635 [Candidatus Pacebacteria bacterium]|jgi:hypothetical protein|nr:hypothetical protein [Candidatus Paceibacterota bacterium]